MVLSLERWCGKVAIVTGASSGIGKSIAEQLVANGIIVAGFARRSERVEENAKKLSDKKGKLYAVKCDVTQEGDILAAFKWVKENLGRVSILVNNAGVVTNSSLIDGDTEKWKQVLDTNVLGLCICTREAIKDMKANNIDGHVIHINSIGGHKVVDLPLNISFASKFGVTALTETLRQELNRENLKIKVTSISPGGVATEIVATSGIEKYFEEHYGKKFSALDPEDISDSVLYVLSTPPHVQIHELMIKPVGEPY